MRSKPKNEIVLSFICRKDKYVRGVCNGKTFVWERVGGNAYRTPRHVCYAIPDIPGAPKLTSGEKKAITAKARKVLGYV